MSQPAFDFGDDELDNGAPTRPTRSANSPRRSTRRSSAASATASGCAGRSPAGATAGTTPTSRSPTTPSSATQRRRHQRAVLRPGADAPAADAAEAPAPAGRRHEGARVRLPRLLRPDRSHRFEDERASIRSTRSATSPRRATTIIRRLVADGLLDANGRRPLSPVPLRIGAVTQRRHGGVARLPHELESQRPRVPAVGRRRPGAGRVRVGPRGGRDRHARPAREPRRHRRHPRRWRDERDGRVRRRAHRPDDRRQPGARAHRARSRGRPQRRRRGGAHGAEDAHRVCRRADRPCRRLPGRHRDGVELDRAPGRRHARCVDQRPVRLGPPDRPPHPRRSGTGRRAPDHAHRTLCSPRRAGGHPTSPTSGWRVVQRASANARRTAIGPVGRLDVVAARIASLDPAVQLARGWSITRRADGRVVRSVGDLALGDKLTTLHRRFDPQHRERRRPTVSPPGPLSPRIDPPAQRRTVRRSTRLRRGAAASSMASSASSRAADVDVDQLADRVARAAELIQLCRDGISAAQLRIDAGHRRSRRRRADRTD